MEGKVYLKRKRSLIYRHATERRWDQMPPELLVQIFQRIPLFSLFFCIFRVCKSWFSSVLDVIFPSSKTLDLAKIDTLTINLQPMYLYFLKKLLNNRPQTQWETLTTPRHFTLQEHVVLHIAERSPLLQYVYVENNTLSHLPIFKKALPYWKNLRNFHCQLRPTEISSLARELKRHCKKIRCLGLSATIGAAEASTIIKRLPNLEILSLEQSALTLDALKIFDGHNGLVEVNLRHCFFLDEKFLRPFYYLVFNKTWMPFHMLTRPKKWNEEIMENLSDTKRYLRCGEKLCPECSWAYP